MDNKVIIDLNEYLQMKKKVDLIDKLEPIAMIAEEDGFSIDPLGPLRHRVKREITISRKNLEEYINEVLGCKDYELKIRED